MRHPFELKITELEAIDFDTNRELTPEETKDICGGKGKKWHNIKPIEPPKFTTLALGEEGGDVFTTQALGEEGGDISPPPSVTTFALGEEGGNYLS